MWLSGSRRDRLAVLLALVTAVCLGSAFFFSKGTQFLMPGPLSSAHGAIENCSACHTKSGSGKLSWVHGLVAGDPHADSKACLTCHKMPDTAFNAHGATAAVLKQSTERLTKIAAGTPQPQSARAQSIAFPTHDMAAGGLSCATCHKEHQGANFKLAKISNEQCRSCHVVKFDSFDGHHPKFETYPFKRRTRIVYDHAGHFGKHFPDVAKKDPAKRIPDACSTCHNSRADKRVMAVAPFEQTCSGCHLDQIIGKERASGPKGIAFLTLPGLDLATLKKKNASIGEWPDASEAALTPFMKVMISRGEQGRALLKTVESLNLQDLTKASDEQIKAVTALAWEIKGLFHALISGKASDVLGDLNIGGRAKLSANLDSDLTASIPRDVVISAQQQWLPNLAVEMANRRVITDTSLAGSVSPEVQPASDPRQATSKPKPKADDREEKLSAERANSEPPETRSDSEARQATPSPSPETDDSEATSKAKLDPQVCVVSVFGQCLMSKGPEEGAEALKPDGGKAKSSAKDLPRAMQAGLKEAGQAAQPEGVTGKTEPANAKPEGGKETHAANEQPAKKAAEQTDDLLFPTEDELRAMKTGSKDAGKADAANAKPDNTGSAEAASKANADAPAGTSAAPLSSIESDVDPESWAEYGGWYRQDYAVFYRPTGHKDKFITSWLSLTGPQAPKGGKSPAAAVFDFLTSKDAQGSCTKCHSVDEIQGKGRVVNFSPTKAESKQGRFTNFIHEPHLGLMEGRAGSGEHRGCLACHELQKGRPYLKSYEEGNPQNFVSNFGAVKKDLCQTCHTSGMARQDCLLCHKYHVNGVAAPIMSTRLPAQ